MNEKELEKAREEILCAYLNPEKYEAEREVFGTVNTILRTPNEKLSKEDKFFKEVTIKALKGDTKALEQVQNYFNERQYDYSIAYDVLSGKCSFEQLNEEDKKAVGRGITPIIDNYCAEYSIKNPELLPILTPLASFDPSTFNQESFVSSLENAKIKDQFLKDVKTKETNYSLKLGSLKDLKIRLLIGSF